MKLLLNIILLVVLSLTVYSQTDKIWIKYFTSNDKSFIIYRLRNGITINVDNNPVITLRVDKLDDTYSIQKSEFNCNDKTFRLIANGSSLETLESVNVRWDSIVKGTLSYYLYKELCK